jgi:hypothetical protein
MPFFAHCLGRMALNKLRRNTGFVFERTVMRYIIGEAVHESNGYASA